MTIQLCGHCERGVIGVGITAACCVPSVGWYDEHGVEHEDAWAGLGGWVKWTRDVICRHCGGLGYVQIPGPKRYVCWAGQGLPKWWADDGEGIGWPVRLVGQSDDVPPTFWAATSYLQRLLVGALERAPAEVGSAITAFWDGFEKGVEHADKGQALDALLALEDE